MKNLINYLFLTVWIIGFWSPAFADDYFYHMNSKVHIFHEKNTYAIDFKIADKDTIAKILSDFKFDYKKRQFAKQEYQSQIIKILY